MYSSDKFSAKMDWIKCLPIVIFAHFLPIMTNHWQKDITMLLFCNNFHLFFWWTKSPFCLFSYAIPQRIVHREVPSQMAAHLRTGSLLKAGEIARFKLGTVGLQSEAIV
jgi:hypothetical protein